MSDSEKRAVAYAAVDACITHSGMSIGLGTGTTAYWAIERIGERVAQGWKMVAVATSAQSQALCRERGIELAELCEGPPIEVAIDGADEVAPDFTLIKGGGGALFRERAVALAAQSFVVIVTAEKLVPQLGAFPLPVEVVPFSRAYVARAIAALGIEFGLRERDGAPFVTDNGNNILDCRLGTIPDARGLDERLRAIHGVVTTGLFYGLTDRVFVGSSDGVRELTRSDAG
ncbi:MAG TPA: ribose-5-phosphate isomerase RpiA [Candidatus Baltobacteraceae bacterium]